MDLILEILVELILEVLFEFCFNKKFPLWIRIPIMFLLVSVYLSITLLLLCTGIKAFKQNRIIGIGLIFITMFIFLLFPLLLFRKIKKKSEK